MSPHRPCSLVPSNYQVTLCRSELDCPQGLMLNNIPLCGRLRLAFLFICRWTFGLFPRWALVTDAAVHLGVQTPAFSDAPARMSPGLGEGHPGPLVALGTALRSCHTALHQQHGSALLLHTLAHTASFPVFG